jgi:hypothetical protein
MEGEVVIRRRYLPVFSGSRSDACVVVFLDRPVFDPDFKGRGLCTRESQCISRKPLRNMKLFIFFVSDGKMGYVDLMGPPVGA